jgi:putative membrane protein
VSAARPEGWQRLHPLSPVVRGGRATIAIAILLLPTAFGLDSLSNATPQLAVSAVLVLAGVVSWLVTRWRVEEDDLRIETGLLRRQSLRYPLKQVQAVDIVRPGLARLFKVAELRLRMGGSSGGSARLAYLAEREVEPLRDRLLALARGAEADEAPPESREEEILTTVPTGQLIASILISDVGIFAEAVVVALIVVVFAAPAAATGVLSGGAVYLVSAFTVVWRRFNQEYKLTVAQAPEGLHLRSGLVALSAETIRPGRVQAVRMVEPFLWRRLGWCRIEVDLAGRQRSKGEGQAQRGQLRAVLPVGSRALAAELLDRLVDDPPREQSPAPRRARWKSPLRYRYLAWGQSERCVVATTGRIRRVTSWVPFEKIQSLRRVQGPLQRRLRLATIHVDVAGKALHASLRDRDEGEAAQALAGLAARSRAARKVG